MSSRRHNNASKMKRINPIFKRVVVGMSGGVDSTVSALILKKKGFDVVGVYMQNWDSNDEIGTCTSSHDIEYAENTCSKLKIPFLKLNFIKEYWNEVFSNLVVDYESGFTPNPDILCNRHIKFRYFLNYCLEKLNVDAIATGHYAATTFGSFLENYSPDEGVRLLKAKDSFKDQSFFLSQVNQKALRKTMFPLSNLTKSVVKDIAKENGFIDIAKRKESTGICFIGTRNFQQFISEYIPNRTGRFIKIDSGDVLGKHKGIHQWTIGQRCKIGGQPRRLFVVKKEMETQDVYVALGGDHPSLWGQFFQTSRAHWIHSPPPEIISNRILLCDFRFQHTHPLVPCRVLRVQNDCLVVTLMTPALALTKGQFAVFYKGSECLGSARITNTVPTLYSISLSPFEDSMV